MNEFKKEDEIFCPECGKPIKRNAVICVNCGVQIKPLENVSKRNIDKGSTVISSKTKTSAIILVIFFGFFGWLYTYRRSAVKFWVALGATIFLFFLSYTIGYYTFIFSFGIWIWALVDVSSKPNSFYENYPNE